MSTNLFFIIELLAFFGVILGIAFWQLYSVRKEIRKSRERKEQASAEQRENHPPKDGSGTPD